MVRRLLLLASTALALSLCVRAPAAAAGIRFARHPALSRDGQSLAFSYLGDIWTVPAIGGRASRLTVHDAHDQLPAWSPDGRWVAFSSRRAGNYDVWLIPSAGGAPRQLTWHSADDLVCGWSPDGREVLFSSSRETTRTTALWAASVANGRTRLIREDDVALAHAVFTPDGMSVIGTRGGSWTRLGYRGSGASNLLLVPAKGGAGRYVTSEPGNERWPMVSPDGKTLFYVSDRTGVPNIWARPLVGGDARQVTRHSDGNLFFPSMARDGSRIAYEHGFGVWLVDLPDGTPREVSISAPSDDRTNPVRQATFAGGVQDMALSNDGKQIGFVVHGEVFTMPSSGGEPARVTMTPQREDELTWSPDGKRLVFFSDRDGSAGLHSADLAAKKTVRITAASALAEHGPIFSPDGKTIAFTRGAEGAELCTIPAAGGEVKALVRDPSIGTVRWSPDSKWLAYDRVKSHSAGTIGDVFIIAATGGRPVNVTRYPGVNSRPAWSPDGRRLYFVSDRSRETHLFRLDLTDTSQRDPDDPPAPPTPANVAIDFAEIHRRAVQVTSGENGIGAYAVAPDSRSIVFTMAQAGRTDLWRVPSAGGAPTRLSQSGEVATAIQFAPDGGSVYYTASGGIRRLVLDPAGSPAIPIGFLAKMEIDVRAEYTQLFDEAWRTMRDSFYDEKMHGCDWVGLRSRYRPVLEHITQREDFITLFTLALGELNASHCGITAPREVDGPSTASLGVRFDDGFTGEGVRVRDVMPRGPADRPASRLAPGDVITAADGVAVASNEALHRALADRAGKRIVLTLAGTGGRPDRTVQIRPISGAAHRQLAYDQWVRDREADVARLSGGRLAYVHLPGMGAANLETFRRAVYSDAQESSGLVLDLRFNGGGSIADRIFSILENRVFGHRTLRGDPSRLPSPMPAFDRPVIVLANEASFSNAEVFPWGFRALKMGKIVGTPTYGGVIGTGAASLIDGTSLRIPAVGAYTLDGQNMENNGCPPDILVEHTPEDIFAGHDRQLEAAVAELVRQIGSGR